MFGGPMGNTVALVIGSGVLFGLGLIAKRLLEKLIDLATESVKTWLKRVNDAINVANGLKQSMDALSNRVDEMTKRVEGWNVNALRNAQNLTGLRGRIAWKRLDQHEAIHHEHRRVLDELADATGVRPPAQPPPLDLDLRDDDHELIKLTDDLRRLLESER